MPLLNKVASDICNLLQILAVYPGNKLPEIATI
ncbi:hypothetical protein BN439_0741 [Erwinia amylovora Ea644]|uniref:Uncharacterized protein n=1 Tax=Erwinia amylovora ATCC BAA-2158 TaxID=889211 RepID=E5B1K1_ERWAM|nr:hypothetical protein predicted by Glimmer/Critica [Erwinia amylovora ATCC BAA-2158]CCP01830.1 hypothetical protein BN439_0741 [Erwinia amylovora Ea644]CCP05853.1 hypothetical protein BN440_0802 [Erwinia amylovora MR1]